MVLKWLKRIVLAIIGLIVALVLLVVGTAFYDSWTGEQTADNTNVEFATAEGQALTGYLATPDTPVHRALYCYSALPRVFLRGNPAPDARLCADLPFCAAIR